MKLVEALAAWAMAAIFAGWTLWTVRTGKVLDRYGKVEVRRSESPYVFWGIVTCLCFISAILVILALSTTAPQPSST